MKIVLMSFLYSMLIWNSLYASTPFSLDNVKALNVHFINDSDVISKESVSKMKKTLQETLRNAGIETTGFNPNTLMVKIESLSQNKIHFIHITMLIGEEVKTNREGSPKTFAITYQMSDFIDSEDPENDVYDSVTEFLIGEFLEQHKEENK